MPCVQRSLTTETELYTAAVTALARRAHSSYEMRKYLERRAVDPALVPPVLARLKVENLIDDARYAAQFVRMRSVHRRQGPLLIARDLRARGVADRHIQAALESVASPVKDREAMRRRIESWLRRHGAARPGDLDRRRMASLYRSLFRAGFPSDAVRAELRRLGSEGESLPEAEADE